MNNIRVINNSSVVLEAFNKQVEKGAKAIGMTAEKYAKRDCPVKTGRLRNSITYAILNAIFIGTNVEYAKYVEYDDKAWHKSGKAHFLRDAATRHNDEYKKIMKAALSATSILSELL